MCVNNFAKIKENDSIVRDLNSHAIITTDNSAFNEYLKRKKTFQESLNDKKRIERLECLVEELMKKLEKIGI